MSAGYALWSTMDESSKEDEEAAGVVRTSRFVMFANLPRWHGSRS